MQYFAFKPCCTPSASLILLHSERPKRYSVLAVLSATGLKMQWRLGLHSLCRPLCSSTLNFKSNIYVASHNNFTKFNEWLQGAPYCGHGYVPLRCRGNLVLTLLARAYKFWWTFQNEIVCFHRWLISSCCCILLWNIGQTVWCLRFFKLYKSILFSFTSRG